MNIILTRPLLDTEDLMSKLLSMGHKIIHVPTLKISKAQNEILNLENYDVLIFTSANAVRNLKFKNLRNKIFCFCVGSITEKMVRSIGFQNTLSAGGTVLALKNLVVNSDKVKKSSRIAYICGDNISHELDMELKKEGYNLDKFVNYISEKITDLSDMGKKLIEEHPPHYIFIYSRRSAESFEEIVRKYSLASKMTQSKVMCISKKIADIFSKQGWKKIEIFNPGEEILKIEN